MSIYQRLKHLFTYFGIKIDKTISLNKQIEILAKKFTRRNGILSKL